MYQRFNNILKISKWKITVWVFFLIGTFTGMVHSQTFGHEWINYSQYYYKFPITNQGIFRIDSVTLANAGINLVALDARNLQIFYRGQEIPIYIQGESDGVLNAVDFIEFYGEKNDGVPDSSLYVNGNGGQINPLYSMFNDTAFYYITWNGSTSNLRYQLETDTNFTAYTPSNYYWYIARESNISDYYEGEIVGQVTSPEYTNGEGYCIIYNGATSHVGNWSGTVLNGFKNTIYTGTSMDCYLQLRHATCNNPSTYPDHITQIDVAGVNNVTSDTSDGYNFWVRNYTCNNIDLYNSTEPFRLDFLATYTPISRNAFGYYELIMPQTFDLGNRTQQPMYLPDAGLPKARLDITNYNNQGSTPWIFDITNARKIPVINSAGSFKALVPNNSSSTPKHLYITSNAAITNITAVYPVSNSSTHYAQFRDFEGALGNKDYVVVSNRSLWTGADLYTTHRDVEYESILIDIEELYDQYGYGIRMNPNSIRNFLKMTNQYWTLKPEHLFLIGKGLRHSYGRNNVTLYNQTLIPSIGVPPTDNLYSFNITNNDRMYCSVGRLAAKDNLEVMDYYNKMIDYENAQAQAPQPLWMKNVLHFSSDPVFNGYLYNYQDIIEDTLFGGHVTNFLKVGSSPYLMSTADSIRNAFDNVGVSLVTIFGHSSGSGFDQIVDEPEEMGNTGKYPWYVVNGCLSGDIFQPTPLVSERFVLEPSKAAIGFIASSSLGYEGPLFTITRRLYENIGVFYYCKPMGTCLMDAISDNTETVPVNGLMRINALGMQMHGDPGLKFNSDTLPDIDLQPINVTFEPAIVTTEMDSVKMRIIINNLGKTFYQNYEVKVTRNFPEPGVPDTTYSFTRPPVYYKDTIEFNLPVSIIHSFGNNLFTVEADYPLSGVEEMPGFEDVNNFINKSLNITTSDIIPVYPYKYAVIPHDTTWLKASTGDPFAPLRTYKFQIDTTDLFNSPWLRQDSIAQSGGVVQWNPGQLLPLPLNDSACYFWRVGIDSAGSGVFYRWKESTFQTIDGKYGWGQDHFFQFKDDDYLFIDHNRPARRFDFVPDFKELKVITYPTPISPFNGETQYSIDGSVQESSGCIAWPLYSALYVFIIDPLTLEPWESYCPVDNNDPSMSGYANFNDNCGCHSYRSEKVFMFTDLQIPAQAAGLESLLNDIPNNYYIGAYTFWNPNFSNELYWTDQVINAFEAIGADTLRYLRDNDVNVPYIFFTSKGNPGNTVEVVGADNVNPIQLVATMQNQWNFGTIKSEIVGPASDWTSFHWKTHSIDSVASNDTAWVTIFKVDTNGVESPVAGLTQIPSTTTDVYSLNSFAPANTYPYLKLYMYTRDDSTVTPAQIDHWHVMYEGVPEAALNPSITWGFSGDTVSQGEDITFHVAIDNIGDYDMDSLQMHYFIVDQNNVTHDFYKVLDSLRVGEYLIDTFTFSSGGYPGISSFYIEANPFTSRHQLEQYHFNNIATRNMFVSPDQLNPLLDVTFDGIHIMDGDIVSAKPFINIQAKDENVMLLMDDTSDFQLYLRYPGQSNPTPVAIGSPEVNFIPASSVENYAKIEYRPDLSFQDGVYELLLRARDISGNQSGYGDSGLYDYKIKFEVINQSTITHLFNYPNPFSTSTQWVFTLTGSEIPSEFTIRIMTISGVVVREITLDELGPIHIGNNVTEFKWNGTDEYGDKLATGVYIYQVITKLNGEVIDHRNTSADKYFKNNFGKLYILR